MPTRYTKPLLIAAGVIALGGVGLWGMAASTATAVAGEVVEVWKSPSCGCCGGWVDHMRVAGFKVKVHDTQDMEAVKKARGVPEMLGSCHTAVVGGYVVEGHVPADDVRRLLAERPRAKGLSVPGMPEDAPGMDMNTGDPYQVVLFAGDDRVKVFSRH